MNVGAEKQSGLRLIAVCVFIGLPLLLAALATLNLVQFGDDRFAMAEKQAQLETLAHRLNMNEAAAKPRDFSAIYITGTSRSLASAALQQYMVDTISQTSGRLVETAAIDAEAPDDPQQARTLRLKATLDTDDQGLLQLLHRLESGLPLLYVETLSVRRLPATDGDMNQKLRIDVAVRGQWRQREK